MDETTTPPENLSSDIAGRLRRKGGQIHGMGTQLSRRAWKLLRANDNGWTFNYVGASWRGAQGNIVVTKDWWAKRFGGALRIDPPKLTDGSFTRLCGD